MKNNKKRETVKDIIMQIWNDGAESVFYSKSDIDSFRRRLKVAMKVKEHNEQMTDLQNIIQRSVSSYFDSLSQEDKKTYLEMKSKLENEIKENNNEV